MRAKSLQMCLTLCDPMDCSLPVFSVHGMSQERVLEWVAISSSRIKESNLLISIYLLRSELLFTE